MEQFQYTDEELAAKSTDALITELSDTALAVYNAKEASLGEELMRELERVLMLGWWTNTGWTRSTP